MSVDLTLQRLALTKFVRGILLVSLNYAELIRFHSWTPLDPPIPIAGLYITTNLGFVFGFLEFVFAFSTLLLKNKWVVSVSLITPIPSLFSGHILVSFIFPPVHLGLILILMQQIIIGFFIGLTFLDLLLFYILVKQKD